jgi:hypothetical protein
LNGTCIGGRAHIVRSADEPGARTRATVLHVRNGAHQRLVDRAVVTTIEYQDARPPGDGARPAQRGAVRVGGGLRHLPERQAEQVREFLTHACGTLRGQHGRDARGARPGQRAGDGRRRVTEHGAGVAQAEIDVAVAVDVLDVDTQRAAHEQRVRRVPVPHPMHGHAAQPARCARLRQASGFAMRGAETVGLAGDQPAQRFTVDAGPPRVVHDASAALRRPRAP